MDRRSSTTKILFGERYLQEQCFISKSKLQTGAFAIGRMLYLCRKEPGYNTLSNDRASDIVAQEYIDDWIDKNVYPAALRTVSHQICTDYVAFKDLRKTENRIDRPNPKGWLQKVESFHTRMTTIGYDIRAQNEDYQLELEKQYDLTMTNDDHHFYNDNCHGAYISICTRTVPKKWLKSKLRKGKENESLEERRAKLEIEQDREKEQSNLIIEQAIQHAEDSYDTDYRCSLPTPTASSSCTPATRSGKSQPEVDEKILEFPGVKTRYGRKTLSEPLMRCLVQCVSKYKVTTNDLLGITMNIANIVFGQKWKLEADEEDDDDDEDNATPIGDDVIDTTPKRKKYSKDLSHTLPSRRTVKMYLDDASMLNLEIVANILKNKTNDVITVGLDDTTKAAGHLKMDVKTDHWTVINQSTGDKQTFTTGYIENRSHSGKDGAEAYEMKLSCLAILADTSIEEIKQQIDFWMSDRASDCAILLENLGIKNEKILKCCAHIVLGIDNSIEKVLKEAERKVGVEKMIKCDNILRSSSSIFTMGLIAITKLLSPSHASHSVSLYNDFTAWMSTKGVDARGFKGFTGNRIGRIAELAKQYLMKEESIKSFFEAVVDTSSNKLVLAVYTFVTNDWFNCCAEVYSLIGELVIFPIIELLGIDNHGIRKTEQRQNWDDVKKFFGEKLSELNRLKVDFGNTITGKGKLISFIIEEVIETLQRQLSVMEYFKEETSTVDPKMQYTPLTNLGCEGEFAKLDNRIKTSGGMTSVKTHSMKNIVATNGLLVKSEYLEKDDCEKRQSWKWARLSDEAKRVRALENDFLATVKIAKELALKSKEKLKQKRVQKLLDSVDSCKKHGGPVTATTISLLDKLNEKQLLTEIGYIRLAITPDIRQKRKITVNGQQRFKQFSKTELQQSIKTILKPESEVSDDIDELLKKALDGKLF